MKAIQGWEHTEDGYEKTLVLDEADVILSIPAASEKAQKIKYTEKIGEIKHLKQAKHELIFGIVGCMAQKEGEALFKRAPHIDFVLGTNNIHELNNIINDIKLSRHHMTKLAPADGVYLRKFYRLPEIHFRYGSLLCTAAIIFVPTALFLM